jgi:hypothetical protein
VSGVVPEWEALIQKKMATGRRVMEPLVLMHKLQLDFRVCGLRAFSLNFDA